MNNPDIHALLSDNRIIAALIGALITLIVSIVSSVISIITNSKNRKLIKEVEFLKTKLQKETIAYQIFRTELTKRKFDKLDTLYENIIEYIEFQRNKLSSDYNLIAEPLTLINESNELLRKTWYSLQKSRIYLSNELINSIQDLLVNCKNATENYSLRQYSRADFAEYTTKLFENVNKLEPMLQTIEDNIKENLNS